MITLSPGSTRTYTLCPYTTLCRAAVHLPEALHAGTGDRSGDVGDGRIRGRRGSSVSVRTAIDAAILAELRRIRMKLVLFQEIGIAHVCTPVTNAHLVCRHLLESKDNSHF